MKTERGKMDIFKIISNIDRRIIYTTLGLVVLIPIIFKLVLPTRVSEPVQTAYDYIQNLPEGSVVMISIDYDASSEPEIQPMLLSILRQCFVKKHKIIMMGQWALGLPLGELGMAAVAPEFNAQYGTDYVNLGYRPGQRAQMVGLGREFRDFFTVDYRNTPVDDLPLMRSIHNYNNIDLLVGLEAGNSGDEWIQFAGARYGLKIIIGATGVIAPDMFHYLQAKQIQGLIGGLQGAAEYEILVNKPGTGVAGMVAQSWAHLLLLGFILLGNLGYFVAKRRKN
jgi:hypothetical protein